MHSTVDALLLVFKEKAAVGKSLHELSSKILPSRQVGEFEVNYQSTVWCDINVAF